MEWNNLDCSKISRIDLSCKHCGRVNIKVKGEDLNCDGCGEDLFALEVQDE